MIGNLNRKDIIALAYITLLSVSSVWYGFSIIPSPAQEQLLAMDQKRVSDLSDINSAIFQYYQTNNSLPPNLSVLTTQAYNPSTPLEKNDPKTQQPYEYTITSPYTYKLCATFVTDSSKQQPNPNDTTSYSYPYSSEGFNHPVGHFCFPEKEVTTNANVFPTSTPVHGATNPTAVLSTFDNKGNCIWTPTFYLQGFAPYSQIRVTSDETLSNSCSANPNQKETSSTVAIQQTDANGTVYLRYPGDLFYGDYSFTFTDTQGNTASLHLTHNGSSSQPTPTPSPTQ